MAQQDKDDLYNENPKDTTLTGSNKAHGDGTVSDEDVDAIDGSDRDGKPIGQDHSTENRENQMPTSGVGAIQDSSLIKENVAHIEDDK
jgi:hypothetical protein